METQQHSNNRKQEIDLDHWVRKDHFQFFSQFSEPFFGVTIRVDCTAAYQLAKDLKRSFFVHYLYQALRAANETEAFRYRISDGKVYLFEAVHASPTINRPDGTFGFAYMDYMTDEAAFHEHAAKVMAEVRASKGLVPALSGANVIHCSALPWLDFTALSHARSFSFPDSCPKISFGKVTENAGRKSMPVSVHVHHALADGFHVGQFAERFAALMAS
ncbi:chloramphenicol acetyltransferase [Pedobacter yulinensis]|uniref:Chloramphenicol acetyltransferase n=1 Tax=Pedobacter yulinensis TaxID=2126353 RepID=A0A2T3HHB0_9SPHI|nr:chloramphenicol acetyltransferase [Pedobacter yulinensis]PST81820.1 chloramphenicol acetyltransferase [Pedobacter yulinensis]